MSFEVGFENHFCQTLWPRWEASKNKHLKFTCLKIRNGKMTEYHPLSYTNTPKLNSKPRGHCDTSHICSPWCRSRSPCRIPRKRDPPGSHQRDMYLRDNKEWAQLELLSTHHGITYNSLMVVFANWRWFPVVLYKTISYYFTIAPLTLTGWNLLESSLKTSCASPKVQCRIRRKWPTACLRGNYLHMCHQA